MWHASRRAVPSPALIAAVVSAIVAGAAVSLNMLAWWERAYVGPAVSDYIAPQYWLTYEDGFSRRALPGQVLAWVSDGATSYEVMRIAALALSLAAVLATVLLAALLALRAAGPPQRRWLAFGLAVGSPLTAVLFVRDVGRYDSVAAVTLAALVALALSRVPQSVARAGAAVLVLVATASQEFLFLLVAPAAIAVVLRDEMLRRRLPAIAAVLGPGALMAAASLLLRPSAEQIAGARERARAAGARLPEQGDTVAALGNTVRDQLSYFAAPSIAELLLTVGVWSGAFGASVVVLWFVLGRPADGYWPLVTYFALLASLLCATNVDMRRWWSLALLGVLAGLAARPPRPRDDGWGGLLGVGSVLLLFVAFVVTRSLPVNVLDVDVLLSLF